MAADYRTLLELLREMYNVTEYGGFGPNPSDDERELIKRVEGAIKPSEAKNDPKLLHKVPVEDRCCSTPMIRAARKGELDKADSYTCPKCGTEYKADTTGNVKHWTAKPSVLVFKR